jgi:glycosyltransferase involved in cell wall biosynthesis
MAFEHFGLTTVEAMSAGCVPIVINKGGQKEIVEDGISGFVWNTPDQLIEKTIFLFQNTEILNGMALNAIKKSQCFSLNNFIGNLAKVI